MRIVWTEPALRDLAAARTYVSLDNQKAAEHQIGLIVKSAGTLLQFPNIGRQGRCEGTRELVVNQTPYLLPYRIEDDRLVILRVLHSRQRWPDQLG